MLSTDTFSLVMMQAKRFLARQARNLARQPEGEQRPKRQRVQGRQFQRQVQPELRIQGGCLAIPWQAQRGLMGPQVSKLPQIVYCVCKIRVDSVFCSVSRVADFCFLVETAVLLISLSVVKHALVGFADAFCSALFVFFPVR
jgi:hypothetical protein